MISWIISHRHSSNLNKETSSVEKDVKMSDEENDVFIFDVDDSVGVAMFVGAILWRLVLNFGESFLLKTINSNFIVGYFKYDIL